MDPVRCKDGHLNDPYPDNGLCIVCRKWLPGNKMGFGGKVDAREAKGGAIEKRKSLKKKTKELLESLGVSWAKSPEYLKMMSETAARSGNTKDMEFLLQQVGELKAKPKSTEDVGEAEVVVYVTAKTAEHLEETLGVLDSISRDRSKDL